MTSPVNIDKIPLSILTCQKCKSFPCDSSGFSTIMDVTTANKCEVICSVCSNIWFICVVCHNKFTLRNTSRMNTHSHFSAPKITIESPFTVDNSLPNNHTNHNISNSVVGPNCQVPTDISDFADETFANDDYTVDTEEPSFNNLMIFNPEESNPNIAINVNVFPIGEDNTFSDKSLAFFKDEHHQMGDGCKGIVIKAFKKTRCTDEINKCSNEESILQFEIAKFANSLIGVQKHQFAKICKISSVKDIFQSSRLPLTPNEVRAFYIEGSHSVIPNLPIPDVRSCYNHAFVSLKSIIQHFVALGIPHNGIIWIDSKVDNPEALMHGINASKAGERIIAQTSTLSTSCNDLLLLHGTFFSDDFVTYGIKSIWIFTVTISPKTTQNTSSR